MWLIGVLTAIFAGVTTWLVTPSVVQARSPCGSRRSPGSTEDPRDPDPSRGRRRRLPGVRRGRRVRRVRDRLRDERSAPAARATGRSCPLPPRSCSSSVSWTIFGPSRSSGSSPSRSSPRSAVWWAGFRIELLGIPFVPSGVELGVWSLPVTILWIVGITNAFNLIDGLDGLAAGTALITTTVVAIIALHGGRIAVSAISVALVGSLAGFLRYNFNPAQIFLGDSGSMFLGFTIAVISIHGSQKNVTAVAVLGPLLIMWYPILDTGMAVARRLNSIRSDSAGRGGVRYMARNAHRVFLPDRGHFHHRLLEAGMSHRGAVLSLYACALATAVAALCWSSCEQPVPRDAARGLADGADRRVLRPHPRARPARAAPRARPGRRPPRVAPFRRLRGSAGSALMRRRPAPCAPVAAARGRRSSPRGSSAAAPSRNTTVDPTGLVGFSGGAVRASPPRWPPATPTTATSSSSPTNSDPSGDEVVVVQPAVLLTLPFSNSVFRLGDTLRWTDYQKTPQTAGKTANDALAQLILNFGSTDTARADRAQRRRGRRDSGVRSRRRGRFPGARVRPAHRARLVVAAELERARLPPLARAKRAAASTPIRTSCSSTTADSTARRRTSSRSRRTPGSRSDTSGTRYDHYTTDDPYVIDRTEAGDTIYASSTASSGRGNRFPPPGMGAARVHPQRLPGLLRDRRECQCRRDRRRRHGAHRASTAPAFPLVLRSETTSTFSS